MENRTQQLTLLRDAIARDLATDPDDSGREAAYQPFAEQIRHQLHIRICGVVHVAQAEAGFDRLEQREVIVFDVLGLPPGE